MAKRTQIHIERFSIRMRKARNPEKLQSMMKTSLIMIRVANQNYGFNYEISLKRTDWGQLKQPRLNDKGGRESDRKIAGSTIANQFDNNLPIEHFRIGSASSYWNIVLSQSQSFESLPKAVKTASIKVDHFVRNSAGSNSNKMGQLSSNDLLQIMNILNDLTTTSASLYSRILNELPFEINHIGWLNEEGTSSLENIGNSTVPRLNKKSGIALKEKLRVTINNLLKAFEMIQLNRAADETFYFHKRPLTASHLSVFTDFEGCPAESADFPSTAYEINAIQNYMEVLFPVEKQEDLLMAAVQIEANTPALSDYFAQEVQRLRIQSSIPQAEAAHQYWSFDQPAKKSVLRSFIKLHHNLGDNQILYFQISDRPCSSTSDLVVRTGHGQILLTCWNFDTHQVQKKIINRLKTLLKQSTLCIFLSESRFRTLDLSFFEQLTKRSIEFLYIHRNFYVNPDYMNFTNEEAHFTLKNIPWSSKICLLRRKEAFIIGSIKAIRMFIFGHLGRFLVQYGKMLQDEETVKGKFKIHGKGASDRMKQLQLAIVNLVKVKQSLNLYEGLEQTLKEVIQHCLLSVANSMEKKQKKKQTSVGHWPARMKHCKECRVCIKKFNENAKNHKKQEGEELGLKKRKTKYMCEECSVLENKPVPLCVLCFKQYHNPLNFVKPEPKVTSHQIGKTKIKIEESPTVKEQTLERLQSISQKISHFLSSTKERSEEIMSAIYGIQLKFHQQWIYPMFNQYPLPGPGHGQSNGKPIV